MENSFADVYPALLNEWDYEKNKKSPKEYTPLSAKTVSWVCPKGHHYDCSINRRVRRGHGCPYCSGKRVLAGFNDLRTIRPEIAKEWNSERNESSPEAYAPLSNKKVWWKCCRCGNEWEAVIANRSRGSGCPRCNYQKASENRRKQLLHKKGSFADTHPELLCEWDYAKNNSMVAPTEISAGSQKRVWWRCKTCGQSWQSEINHRSHGSRCPRCSYQNRQAPNRRAHER